jgi:O-antigen/teichoic acid export membrane protein
MFMVNIFLNPVAVGFYSIAVTLAEKIGLISESTGTILFPQVSSETNKERLNKFTPLVCRNTLFITMLCAIFLFLIGRWLIILLYSKEFSDSVLPFQILLIGSITISGWRILANDLYGRGKPLLNSYITGVSVIINIILNIIFIPKFGISGASWATAISYTIALIMITIVYSRISGNRITDILFVKKSDLKYYKNIRGLFKNKVKSQ